MIGWNRDHRHFIRLPAGGRVCGLAVFDGLHHLVDPIAERDIAQNAIVDHRHDFFGTSSLGKAHADVAALVLEPRALNDADDLVHVVVEQQRGAVVQTGQVSCAILVRKDLVAEPALDGQLAAEWELDCASFSIDGDRLVRQHRPRQLRKCEPLLVVLHNFPKLSELSDAWIIRTTTEKLHQVTFCDVSVAAAAVA